MICWMTSRTTFGFSLIGLLVSVVCMLVLAMFMLTALNKAMTGAGTALPGTVSSYLDKEYLRAVFQSMAVSAQTGDGRFIVPSDLARSRDRSDDTTANLFSAMLAQHYTVPGQLISGNEYNPNVWRDEDYDFAAYYPAGGVYWDPTFVADLEVESNTSFAHVPLFGERFKRSWRFTADSRTPILGNRGPKAGVDDPNSYTYGRDGRWAGHIVFGDGHVEFIDSFTPSGLFYDEGGQRYPDNIFAMEEGESGSDAILTFTKEMTPDGPIIQHD